jgi:hypothetical protein
MTRLINLELNFQDADAFYERLLDAHLGLSPAQSALLNARLVLVFANQLGDSDLLQSCLDAARLTTVDHSQPL